ncbi:MAG: hypothetical protein HY779_00595 [Rubrobacteridae bacterium]|nr:hypothetical protein [Rubrobacteridae bacterium]
MKDSLIAPISSLHRYLSEANDSVLIHANSDDEHDITAELKTPRVENLAEYHHELEIHFTTNKQ